MVEKARKHFTCLCPCPNAAHYNMLLEGLLGIACLCLDDGRRLLRMVDG